MRIESGITFDVKKGRERDASRFESLTKALEGGPVVVNKSELATLRTKLAKANREYRAANGQALLHSHRHPSNPEEFVVWMVGTPTERV